ncbi:MAG: pantetheine-phosphate adenylyltransferase [Bacteroidota bacterium]|nr:pantetheine-phosphate adenylyltransferase [Bacteroidota bacterium]
MKRIAVFPGSFDPFTIGHESIVRRALLLFDEIIIAIGKNTNKNEFYSIEKREEWIRTVFQNEAGVKVMSYEGMTVDFCKSRGAGFLLRGLRTAYDFEYERAIAQVNKAMESDIESVFLLTSPEHTHINSSIVRDILRQGGDASKFLPGNKALKEKIINDTPKKYN